MGLIWFGVDASGVVAKDKDKGSAAVCAYL